MKKKTKTRKITLSAPEAFYLSLKEYQRLSGENISAHFRREMRKVIRKFKRGE